MADRIHKLTFRVAIEEHSETDLIKRRQEEVTFECPISTDEESQMLTQELDKAWKPMADLFAEGRKLSEMTRYELMALMKVLMAMTPEKPS